MIRWLYKKVLKPILFKMDPEFVHDLFVSFGSFMGKTNIGRSIVGAMYRYKGPDIGKTVDGIYYKTPVLLAAGFDYNGRLANILDKVGFGGEEIGSVTARLSKGNKKPRLRRMIKSKGLIVYKGLKNDGVEAIISRLKKTKKRKDLVWGISIAKTNDKEAATVNGGILDYYTSLSRLVESDTGDFYTINISCPNVHGGESFTTPELLKPLMEKLDTVNHSRPVYVKMPIHLPWEQFNELLEVLDQSKVNGIVVGNLNKNYDEADFPEEAPEEYRGGLSGKICRKRSTSLIMQTKSHWQDRFTIIGCGGILSVSDAQEKLDAGADLLQLITGMIFEGPHLMKDIGMHMAEKKCKN